MNPIQRTSCRLALLLAGVLALGACGGGGGGGSAPETPPEPAPPTGRVSGPSPFAAGCGGAAAVGTLYVNAEVEPLLAINPRDPAHLVGAWQQDRWSSGGAQGLLAGVSFDGGLTWERHAAPFSRCTGGTAANGGDYERASDPWVSFGPDGTVYQIALALTGATFQANSANAILASRSTDGGRSWSDPATLKADGFSAFNDKQSITADPTDARLVYATWDRVEPIGGGPSYFSRSTDGGLSWEPAVPIYDPGRAGQTLNNQIVVLPDGTLVDFFTLFDQVGSVAMSATLSVIRSLDKGLTWSAPIAIATMQALGVKDPDTGARVRDGANLGAIAVGPQGELVAVWQDARFSGGARDAVALARSQDGGLSWSAPVRVNHDPTVPAFVPGVAVRGDGTIGVAYYDFRGNTPDPGTLPTDYWLAQSADGVTWTESHVAGPFDLAIAPNADGLFLGDYQGLAAAGGSFVPLFARTSDGDLANRTDIYAMAVPSIGGAAAKALPATGAGAPMKARPAPALALTPALQERLTESALLTLQRRMPGWTPRGFAPAGAPSPP